jgi:hypothetical protein
VAVPPGELLADADLIHYTVGASEKDEEAIRKALDFSTTARRQAVDWSGAPWEARFWERKLGPVQAHYLWGAAEFGEPHI